jgi:transposase-like protein|tara:strand:- start:407 stop:694 length:288 start_codon:yes stop_codon:yes gene_type:complete
MARKNYSPEQIIRMLRETEVYIGEGMTAREAARQIGVTEQTYYRWRKEYGGMQISQAKRLKVLEKENIRLKRLVAEKELDIQILRETIAFESKNF